MEERLERNSDSVRLVVQARIQALPILLFKLPRVHWGISYKEQFKWRRLVKEALQDADLNALDSNHSVLTLIRHSHTVPTEHELKTSFTPVLEAIKFLLPECYFLDTEEGVLYGWQPNSRRQKGFITMTIGVP